MKEITNNNILNIEGLNFQIKKIKKYQNTLREFLNKQTKIIISNCYDYTYNKADYETVVYFVDDLDNLLNINTKIVETDIGQHLILGNDPFGNYFSINEDSELFFVYLEEEDSEGNYKTYKLKI